MNFRATLVARPDYEMGTTAYRTLRYAEQECFPVDEDLDFNAGWWWVLRETETQAVVGFCGMTWAYADRVKLLGAGVLPAYRGKHLQLRMIRLRERKARVLKAVRAITYTSSHNPASCNSLIRAGYLLYCPAESEKLTLKGHDWLHWYKDL